MPFCIQVCRCRNDLLPKTSHAQFRVWKKNIESVQTFSEIHIQSLSAYKVMRNRIPDQHGREQGLNLMQFVCFHLKIRVFKMDQKLNEELREQKHGRDTVLIEYPGKKMQF